MANNSDSEDDRIQQNLLSRLRWNIFGELSDIGVVENFYDAETTPFLTHAIAAESLAQPPLAKVSVHIGGCEMKAVEDDSQGGERYKAPKPLVLEPENGTFITIGDFVKQTHAYLKANREEIATAEEEFYWTPADGDFGEEDDEDDDDDDDEEDEGEDDGDAMDTTGGENEAAADGESWFREQGNIPTDAGFYFQDAIGHEVGKDEYQIIVEVFVEGSMGISLKEFWDQREYM